MISKSKGWILIGVLLAAALTATGVAQVATTQVADTIYHADGTAATGTAIVSWPAFTTGAGDAIPSGSVSATIAAGGALSVQLVPNAGATPMGSYYTVVYHLDDGTVSRQYWVVPASAAAVKVSAVESTVLPASVAMQTVSKSYVDTAIAAAVAGHPLDSTPYVLKAGDTMTGPLLLPADPVSAAQAADKHYVDASVAAVSGGLGQSSATPPQTQYAVPAYLLSPSGGMALPGASHLSVDPTGYNLSGFHANFTNLGVSASQADCTQVGGLFGGNSCLGLSVYYPGDAGHIEWGQVINFNSYGPGQNLGQDGTPNSRITTPFSISSNVRNRGGNAANLLSMTSSRVGDWGPWYAYDYSDGGTQAPSDEGMTVAGTYEGGESYGYFHGTVLTGGSGATTPTFNFTGGCGSMNACTPTDGGILLDTQTAVASGYFTGPSYAVSTGAVPLKALPVSATLPITTAWGHAEGLSIPATADRNMTAPATIALTMVTGSFSPGDHVCVEGTAAAGGFDEHSTVTSVSGGSITLPLAYSYTNVAIFKGGPCGTYISFSANLALSGYRTSYHAIASFTGSDLIYAVPSSFGLNGSIGAGLPQAGAEPETTGGTSDPNAAFQTFCGAEIDEALSPNSSNVQLDPNSCAWTVGDTVESPHFPSQKVYGLFMMVNQNMPNLSNEGTGGINLAMSGMGVAGYTQGYQVNNLNSNAWYTSDGGKLAPPGCAFCATGTWYDDLLTTAPADSILRVNAHLPGQTSYNLFEDGTGSGFGGAIGVSAAGFNFSTSVNTAGGFNGGGLNATGPINTITSGSTAEVSIINGSLTHATPSFTQAGYLGTRADFGTVAYATTGPVTPLLSIMTDATYLGTDESGLVAYNGSTAVPFLSVRSGSFGDTNLTIENGTTHCATLICLGPDATVDSSGNVAASGTIAGANFIDSALTPGTSPICPNGIGGAFTTTGCSGGGGGGGGGVAGSGATGYIPKFTGSTAVGNSSLDDGVTTAGVLTTPEQITTNGGSVNIATTLSGGNAGFFLIPSGADEWAVVATGSASPPNTISVFNATANKTPLAIFSHAGVSSVGTYSAGVFGWNADASYASGTLDTGLSRDSAGVVDVGNGTAGSTSGAIDATLYKGPATAPSGSCSAIGWEFTQDGHATFCNGSTWVTKI
jgi:hypothetical protein